MGPEDHGQTDRGRLERRDVRGPEHSVAKVHAAPNPEGGVPREYGQCGQVVSARSRQKLDGAAVLLKRVRNRPAWVDHERQVQPVEAVVEADEVDDLPIGGDGG